MSKEICSISGEELIVSPLLLGMDFRSVHPIFKAKKSLILSRNTVFNYHKAHSWREKKLWFLAVLNCTDLVTWKVPAIPEPHTIEFAFETAFEIAGWVDYARHAIQGKLEFPQYICSIESGTQALENIPIFLSEIQKIKELFLKSWRDDDLKRELNENAQRVENEFRKGNLFGLAFTRELAKFALDAARCPKELYDQYLTILTTPLEDAWMIGRDRRDGKHLTEEIYELFEEELPVHHQSFLSVRLQAKKLMETALEAYQTNGKNIKPSSIQKDFIGEIEFEILPSSSNLILPLPAEPQRKNFLQNWKYLAAKAEWELEKSRRSGGLSGEYKQF